MMATTTSPSLAEVYGARQRLASYLQPTPLLQSRWLSEATGASVQLKVESLQLGRSFKIRGAMNAALRAAAGPDRPRLVVTASAGNHGRALAIAAERLGMRAVVFTPMTAPNTKKTAIRQHGAELRDDCADFDAAEKAARNFAGAEAGLYISPYNHADVIAGAGTIALEILEARPAFDVLVVPLGGGGLASGLAVALKSAAPGVTIVGVEVEASTPFATSIARGAITQINVARSIADGLTGNLEADAITFDIVRRLVDRLVTVTEQEVRRAVRGLAAEEHLIAEGAGATATAAVLAGRVVEPNQRAVVMLTGGNIDLAQLSSIIASD
jgi:threonine dehydratase